MPIRAVTGEGGEMVGDTDVDRMGRLAAQIPPTVVATATTAVAATTRIRCDRRTRRI
jgi:hypothetical protein